MKGIFILVLLFCSSSLLSQNILTGTIEVKKKAYYGGYDYVQGPMQDSLPALSSDRYYLYVWYLKKDYTSLIHYENTGGKTADIYPIDQVGTIAVRLEVEERTLKGNKRIRVVYYSEGWVEVPQGPPVP